MKVCEKWTNIRGCSEFSSDCEWTNTQSEKFHEYVGFKQVAKIICFAKKIDCWY